MKLPVPDTEAVGAGGHDSSVVWTECDGPRLSSVSRHQQLRRQWRFRLTLTQPQHVRLYAVVLQQRNNLWKKNKQRGQ